MKMNLLRKALVLLAGIAVLVLVMSVAVPRAVHAVAAALVRDVDNAARHPFASICSAAFSSSISTTCSITIPVGEEVVLQTETIFVDAGPGIPNARVNFSATSAGTSAEYVTSVPLLPGTDSQLSFIGSLIVPADPGSIVTCSAIVGVVTTGGGMSCAFVGYYVTLP